MSASSSAHQLPSRRALLSGALGGLATVVAGALGAARRRVEAAAGDVVHAGETTVSGSATTILQSNSDTSATLLARQNGTGAAVRGEADKGTGGRFSTARRNRFGLIATNAAETPGAGAAIQAIGNEQPGLIASTTRSFVPAVKGVHMAHGDPQDAGPGVQGFAYGGTRDDLFTTFTIWHPGGGEFAGPNGVIGACNVEGFSGVVGVSPAGQGVYGHSLTGTGVRGQSGTSYGVFGISTSNFGVYGNSSSSNGVRGSSNSGIGVRGTSSVSVGVNGTSSSQTGVSGQSTDWIGVYGQTSAANGEWAGWFQGDVNITGAVASPSTATMVLDHPADAPNRILRHAAVVSDGLLATYGGTATTDAAGRATVTLPAYASALTEGVRYQLTVVGGRGTAWVERELDGARFVIGSDPAGVRVDWQVIGTRRDAWARAHPLSVEAAKPDAERGTYLTPLEHGQPVTRGRAYERLQASILSDND